MNQPVQPAIATRPDDQLVQVLTEPDQLLARPTVSSHAFEAFQRPEARAVAGDQALGCFRSVGRDALLIAHGAPSRAARQSSPIRTRP